MLEKGGIVTCLVHIAEGYKLLFLMGFKDQRASNQLNVDTYSRLRGNRALFFFAT